MKCSATASASDREEEESENDDEAMDQIYRKKTLIFSQLATS
eukprot:IDg3259t1